MIVPMKKVTLIALQNERESALASLRDLGVMQIELEERFSSESSAVADRVSFLKRMYDLLEQYAVENKMLPAKKSAVPAMDAANETYANAEKRAAVESKLVELSRRLENLAVWGDFDRSLLEKLKNTGDMVKVDIASTNIFDKGRKKDETHEMAVLGSEDGSLKVYVDKKLVLTLTGNGFDFTGTTSSIASTTGNDNGPANMADVASEMMNGAQIACGYAMNINLATNGVLTNALFHDSVFSQDGEEIEVIMADYVG